MNTPVTTLDQRNSDEDAIPAGWEETRTVLETAELFWIATVRADVLLGRGVCERECMIMYRDRESVWCEQPLSASRSCQANSALPGALSCTLATSSARRRA
jgi:hypothetical protein